MRILFCPTHYVFDDGERGSELSWAFQITHRLLIKYPLSVIVTGFKNTQKSYPFQIVQLQSNKKQIDLGIKNTLAFNFLYSKYLFQVSRKEKFEIQHHVLPFAIDRTFNIPMIISSQKVCKKVIGPIQSSLPFFEDNIHDVGNSQPSLFLTMISMFFLKILHPILKILSKKTLLSADAIVVINKHTKLLLVDKGIPKNKITVIPPGIDCKAFDFDKKDLKKKKVEILAVGSLISRKGFDVIIKGVAQLSKTHDNFVLKIVGEGPQKKKLQKMVKEYGMTNRIEFIGQVSHNDMAKYYKTADIFISMSRAEGFATVCLEAMVSGLAVIATKVGGFNEAIENGVDGYLVDIDDHLALNTKIKQLLDERSLLHRLGSNARKKMEKYYDWNDVIIPKYIEVYNSVLR